MSDDPDLSPVIEQDPFDLRLSIASIVHWADSRDVRVRVMEQIGFPVDDIPMFVVVNQLAYRGALRPTDLAATLGTGKANISKIVRRLEEIGLVARVPAPRDERSVLVALTGAGRELGERIMEVAQAQVDEVTLGWDPQEVENLRRYVARFARQAFAGLSMTPGLRERP